MLIKIDGLCASIGGVPILRGIDLALEEGEIYGLLGPNGAGKSTTIALALGLLAPDAGCIRVLDNDPLGAGPDVHRRLGALPERIGLYDWMSGEEYLAFFAKMYGHRCSEVEIRSRLATVGLEPRRRQTIASYSRGMRQRLGLARALIPDPKLLVLDEPTSSLDPRGRREIHDLLLGLAARGVGILLCTHLLDDVDRLCRRIGIIVAGRTVAEGTIADLVRGRGHGVRFRLRLAGQPPDSASRMEHVTVVAHEGEWWVVDLDPGIEPDGVWRELLFRGWRVVEIQRAGGGLEDLYLSLTDQGEAA